MPETIGGIAEKDPNLVPQTLVKEMDRRSDTATYLDTIDPYKFDTREVFITTPYDQYLKLAGGPDMLRAFNKETGEKQKTDIKNAANYFGTNGKIDLVPNFANPVITVVSSLVNMAQSGAYENLLKSSDLPAFNETYADRFIADTGVLDTKAKKYQMTTEQYGMIHEEPGNFPIGAWWLTPIGVLDHTILANDPNQDRDGALILGGLVFLLIAFPYIPYLNRLPEKIGLDKFIWKE